MALKPEYSVMSGLALATTVFAIHQQATPTQADIQALPAGTADIDTAEKRATWISAATVSVVSLLVKDPTMFVIGSGMVVAMALWTRNSNWTEGVAGMFQDEPEAAAAGTETTGPEPSAVAPAEMFGGGSEFTR